MEVVFRPQAEDEVLEVRQWYESKRFGLGREFGEELNRIVERIAVGYDTAGRVSTLSDPSGVGLTFTYDGPLPLTETWNGTVEGRDWASGVRMGRMVAANLSCPWRAATPSLRTTYLNGYMPPLHVSLCCT